MATRHLNSNDPAEMETGSVLIELMFGIGLLILLSAAVVDFGLGFQNYGGAVNAARDLARIGAGYDLNVPAGGGGMMSACQFVCSKTADTLCSYGLSPSSYSVSVNQSSDYPEMLQVGVARNGFGSFVWQYSILPTASAVFTMEGPLASVAFNSQGCGTCPVMDCP